jgi:small subunit ribosomal protein S8
MAAENVLANMFSAMYNNEIRNKKECLVIPASRLASDVLRTLQRNRYIGEFEQIDDGRAGKLRIQLLGRINKCGVVSPRFSVKKEEFGRWERRFLPAVGVGILIMTTTQGVMSHGEAAKKGVGGRLLGYVY